MIKYLKQQMHLIKHNS